MINSTQINLNHYQMTACYYPNGVLSKPLERFRFLNTIKLNYGVNNVKLDDLITTILMVHCKMNIMGYNTITQKYWGKKYNGTICELHIELQINNQGDHIWINPLIGSDLHIKKMVAQLKQAIELYIQKQRCFQ
jgi:hypothetical protein